MVIPEVRPYTLPYQPSGGLWFDGSSGYVDCGNDSSIDINDPFTIVLSIDSVWENNTSILSKAGTYVTAEHGWFFRYLNPGWLYFVFGDGTNGSSIGWGAFYPTDNVPYYIALTRNGSNFTYYVDGTEKATTISSLNISVNNNLTVASYKGSGRFSKCNFYELVIIAEALSQSEIRGLMKGRRDPREWDCRLWLDFRQGHTRDLSGNGNHGTLYGGAYFV